MLHNFVNTVLSQLQLTWPYETERVNLQEGCTCCMVIVIGFLCGDSLVAPKLVVFGGVFCHRKPDRSWLRGSTLAHFKRLFGYRRFENPTKIDHVKRSFEHSTFSLCYALSTQVISTQVRFTPAVYRSPPEARATASFPLDVPRYPLRVAVTRLAAMGFRRVSLTCLQTAGSRWWRTVACRRLDADRRPKATQMTTTAYFSVQFTRHRFKVWWFNAGFRGARSFLAQSMTTWQWQGSKCLLPVRLY